MSCTWRQLDMIIAVNITDVYLDNNFGVVVCILDYISRDSLEGGR